jgi:hypothetical protein
MKAWASDRFSVPVLWRIRLPFGKQFTRNIAIPGKIKNGICQCRWPNAMMPPKLNKTPIF